MLLGSLNILFKLKKHFHLIIYFKYTDGPDSVAPNITCPADQPEYGSIIGYSGQETLLSFPAAEAVDVNDAGNPTTPMINYQVCTVVFLFPAYAYF